MSEDPKPKLIDTVIINDDDEAPSLLNPLNGEVFVTNKVGLYVMQLADGSRSQEQIADDVCDRFKGAARGAVEQDVSTFLELGREKELLT